MLSRYEQERKGKNISDAACEVVENAGPQQKYDYLCKLIKFVTK